MKRRSGAAAVTARPVEFLPRHFFLLVVRETPRFTLDRHSAATSKTIPLRLPVTPGIEFVEFTGALLEPRGHETPLDATHTIRFCRFMNAARRKHRALGSSTNSGQPQQVHFVARSHVRGDEAALVLLLVRWRLLCLELSPTDALAPFQHLRPLLSGFGSNVERSLAGIARGVASDLLFSKHELQRDTEDDTEREKESESSCFTRITARFLLFASPLEQPSTSLPSGARGPDVAELERPPTVDAPATPACEPVATLDSLEPPALPRVSVAQLAAQLRQHRVAMVVKLNAHPRYDDQLIIRSGVDHLDLSGRSDLDGVDRAVVARFLESCEHLAPQSAVAVHSSTGLGRAALCVACFLVKHAQFSAAEAAGWVRFCCPGAIPPWHERILETMEAALLRDGDEFRRRRQAAQDERSSLVSPRTTLGRLSLSTVDDLALAASARLASQISIGKIALGRDSLLGTQKEKSARDHRESSSTTTTSSSLSSPAQIVPLQRSPGGSYRELIASDAVLGAQQKRRPLTQGAVGRRRLSDHYHHHAHGDFATLHKFLHQASSPIVSSHATPQRPTATAPDRSCASLPSSTTMRGSVHAASPTQQHSFD